MKHYKIVLIDEDHPDKPDTRRGTFTQKENEHQIITALTKEFDTTEETLLESFFYECREDLSHEDEELDEWNLLTDSHIIYIETSTTKIT